jgi:hypothetical protein
MAITKTENHIYQVNATTDDGKRLLLNGVTKTKSTYYKVEEINGGISIMTLFDVLAKVCKSGLDTQIIGKLIDSADKNNEITIVNISKFADTNDISRESLKRLLNRATDEALFHKIDTGHYMVNPYIIMSKGLTAGGYELQENRQIEWRKITGLITATQLNKLVVLSNYLGLQSALRATEFNLSVAEYYANNGEITDKQREALVKLK